MNRENDKSRRAGPGSNAGRGHIEAPGFAEARPGGKLHSEAAHRNTAPIVDLLRDVAPKAGRALELASGTGQHVVHLAAALSGLTWQPSDIDPARRVSIDGHAAEAGLANIRPAANIDACGGGWSAIHGGQSLIFLSNLLHLVPAAAADRLIEEVARALAPGGCFVLYGPFKRGGALTSDGDTRFHAQLKAADPLIGYKDDVQVADMLHANWLELDRVVEMPANNLAFVAHRRA